MSNEDTVDRYAVEQMVDGDDDDAFAVGDPTVDALDPVQMRQLAARIDEVNAEPEGDARNLAAVGLLSDLYGTDLVVL